jgi:hypothetical protein
MSTTRLAVDDGSTCCGGSAQDGRRKLGWTYIGAYCIGSSGKASATCKEESLFSYANIVRDILLHVL